MRTWVTADDFIRLSGSTPYTPEDLQSLEMCCDAVTGWVRSVRPDLTPPETVTVAGVGTFAAYRGMVKPDYRSPGEQSTVHWAALQLVKRWWEKRGASQVSGFAELGFIPSIIDKDIEEALAVGRAHGPVIA